MVKSCSNCEHSAEAIISPACSKCWKRDGYPGWAPSVSMTAPGLLAAALRHMEDRAATYDKQDGERSMARTVAVFNSFHDLGMTEAQGWHFMQILKDVRLFSNPDKPHRDSIEDGIAYAALKGEAMLNG